MHGQQNIKLFIRPELKRYKYTAVTVVLTNVNFLVVRVRLFLTLHYLQLFMLDFF
jgi:hypothetical protein